MSQDNFKVESSSEDSNVPINNVEGDFSDDPVEKEKNESLVHLNLDETLLLMSLAGATASALQGYVDICQILQLKGLSISLKSSATFLSQMKIIDGLSKENKLAQLELVRAKSLEVTQILESYMQKEGLSHCVYSPSTGEIFSMQPTCQRFLDKLINPTFHKAEFYACRASYFIVGVADYLCPKGSDPEDALKKWCDKYTTSNLFALNLDPLEVTIEMLLDSAHVKNGTFRLKDPVPLSLLGTTLQTNSTKFSVLGAAVVQSICGAYAVIFSDKNKDQRSMEIFRNTIYDEESLCRMPLVVGAEGTLGDVRTNDAIFNTFKNPLSVEDANYIALEDLPLLSSERVSIMTGTPVPRSREYITEPDSKSVTLLTTVKNTGKSKTTIDNVVHRFVRCVFDRNVEPKVLDRELGVYRVGINDYAAIVAHYPGLLKRYSLILIDPFSQFTLAVPNAWISNSRVREGLGSKTDLGKVVPGIGMIIYKGISTRLAQICSVFTASVYLSLLDFAKSGDEEVELDAEKILDKYSLFTCISDDLKTRTTHVNRLFSLVRLDMNPLYLLSPKDWKSSIVAEFLSSTKISCVMDIEVDSYDSDVSVDDDLFGDQFPTQSVGEDNIGNSGRVPDANSSNTS